MLDGLKSYLDSVRARDPAPRSRWEILLYPGVWALFFHRIAHWLFDAKLYFLARFVNHFSRLLTGIDIHPGATIGKNFFIDHGFTVIGETAEIGDNVTIYQCVTLGGTNPTNGVAGKRHPTLEDNVIIGSGAQIIGPITVGKRARVGASAVVLDDVHRRRLAGEDALPVRDAELAQVQVEPRALLELALRAEELGRRGVVRGTAGEGGPGTRGDVRAIWPL